MSDLRPVNCGPDRVGVNPSKLRVDEGRRSRSLTAFPVRNGAGGMTDLRDECLTAKKSEGLGRWRLLKSFKDFFSGCERI